MQLQGSCCSRDPAEPRLPSFYIADLLRIRTMFPNSQKHRSGIRHAADPCRGRSLAVLAVAGTSINLLLILLWHRKGCRLRPHPPAWRLCSTTATIFRSCQPNTFLLHPKHRKQASTDLRKRKSKTSNFPINFLIC